MFKFDPVYEHWQLSSLQESQRQDCHLCVILHRALQQNAPQHLPPVNLACHVQVPNCPQPENALKLDFIYQDRKSSINQTAATRISLRAYLETGKTALESDWTAAN